MSTPPAILAVCTGNICRSPAVELLLGDALRSGGLVAAGAGLVRSAGTRAVVGAPVDAQVAALLASDGVDVDGFRARQVSADLLREPALVLTLTRAHRTAVVQTLPAAVRRTFTLRELAHLVGHIDSEALASVREHGDATARVTALVAAAHRARAVAGPALSVEDLDVVDPYLQPDAVHARAYAEITSAVQAVARALVGQ